MDDTREREGGLLLTRSWDFLCFLLRAMEVYMENRSMFSPVTGEDAAEDEDAASAGWPSLSDVLGAAGGGPAPELFHREAVLLAQTCSSQHAGPAGSRPPCRPSDVPELRPVSMLRLAKPWRARRDS